MFDLNKAIHQYARRVSTNWFRRGKQIVELEDHLHCAIEQLMAGGLSTEKAFEEAILQLGDACQLQSEYRKNKRRLSVLTKLRQKMQWRILRHGLIHPRLTLAIFCLLATIPAVNFFQKPDGSRWPIAFFESCFAFAAKIVGIFGE